MAGLHDICPIESAFCVNRSVRQPMRADPCIVKLFFHSPCDPAQLLNPLIDITYEVIDAIGFDFISQPLVTVKAKKERQKGKLFTDFVLEISEFRAQTLATDPEDFANFETFSMAMVDLDYDGDVFRLGRVFWGEDLLKEAGGLEEAKHLAVRIPEEDFTGKRLMLILCDRYGNEKTLVFEKKDFR